MSTGWAIHFVAPPNRVNAPKVKAFRDWLRTVAVPGDMLPATD